LATLGLNVDWRDIGHSTRQSDSWSETFFFHEEDAFSFENPLYPLHVSDKIAAPAS